MTGTQQSLQFMIVSALKLARLGREKETASLTGGTSGMALRCRRGKKAATVSRPQEAANHHSTTTNVEAILGLVEARLSR
ncbi:hypothetical protein [Bradyrhizobium yuanmingense]|uniref:hypothetical protein n=1 Tax=Bradyrhizobium yuanmingense TaxID=108015 RepID=UPI0012FE32D4|nr:hypothetical protein [Bradyrhizobium yuanmingense]